MNNGNTQRKNIRINSKDTFSTFKERRHISVWKKLIEEQQKSQGENGSRVHIDKGDILKTSRKKDHLKRNKTQVTWVLHFLRSDCTS